MAKRPKIKDTKVSINEELEKQIENDVKMYISTSDVKMTDDGIWVHGKYGFYQISNFPFFIKHLIKDSKDNVFRIIEIPIEKIINIEKLTIDQKILNNVKDGNTDK